MGADPFTAVGRIAKTHGLKGEVSVVMYTEASLDVLVGLDAWLVPPPASVRATRILSVRMGPKGPLFSLEGVDTIDVASTLTGRELLVSTDALPEDWAEEDEEPTVLGWQVVDVERGVLGEVVELIETGANDVWTVEGPFGEVLIPVIDDVVVDVEADRELITVRLLPGLLPEEMEEA